MMRDLVSALNALFLVILPGFVASCASAPQPPINLLLITIDTLRADHLGFAGYVGDTSPTIDRLAAEGTRFLSTYSQAGWTLPSIATILTGRYPNSHGAIEVNHSIDPRLETLAAILSEAGYDTRGFVSHVMLSPKHGFAKGFDVYDDSVLDVGHPHKVSTADLLTDRVLAELPSGETPFFLWVHYFDPHFDYLPHEPWSDRESTELQRYDGEIAFTDRQIGRLLDGLANAGLMERTLTVVTADHGEAFGERGARHHFSTFEEVVRVPLILHGPTIPSHDSTRPAQQIDLLPTILGLFRLDPPTDLPGHDLLAEDRTPADVFIERYRPSPFIQRALIRGDEKLVKVEVTPDAREAPERIASAYKRTKIRPGIFLYDLEADPGETTNLFSDDDPEAVELLAELEEYSARSAQGVGDLEIDEETRDRLEALGYLN